jgi:hypothetical protein
MVKSVVRAAVELGQSPGLDVVFSKYEQQVWIAAEGNSYLTSPAQMPTRREGLRRAPLK